VGHFFVACSGGYEFSELLRIDLRESEKDLIHWAIEMVIAAFAGKLGSALI